MSDELPQGWAETTLRDAGIWRTGGTPSRRRPEFFGKGIAWVKSGDLPDGPILKTEEEITQLGLENSSAKLMPVGTISMALYGATIGKLGVMTFPAATNQACENVVPDTRLVQPKYLLQYLLSERRNFIEQGQGGAQPNITQEIVRTHPFKLAPLPEQQRIVAKLDALLSKVDACQQRLAKIPVLLKRFRQSVLAAACSGRVTADWREQNPSTVVGDGRLKCILSDRRRLWEAGRLQKFKERGITPKDDLWKREYEEVKQADTHSLSEIPTSWTWITFACLVARVKRGPSMKCNQEAQGVRYVTSGNLENGKLRLDYDQKFLAGFDDIRKCQLLPRDLILNCVNSLEKIGKSAVFETQHGEAIVGFNNYALELEPGVIDSYYLNLFCQSEGFRRQLHLVVKHAVNQVSFATDELSLLCVPLPPLPEQQEIVRRVDKLFALADALETGYAKANEHVEKLTPSVLAKAFRGELVPQDPNDEPAAKLLERIWTKDKDQEKSRKTHAQMRSTSRGV